eukprot:UN01623
MLALKNGHLFFVTRYTLFQNLWGIDTDVIPATVVPLSKRFILRIQKYVRGGII